MATNTRKLASLLGASGAGIANDGTLTSAAIGEVIVAGDIAAGAVDTTELADNAVTLAKMAGGTDGNIISFDASGDPVAIATGSDGQVLTSTGAGSPPAFEAIPASGINSPWEHIGSWATAADVGYGNVQFKGVFDRYHTMYRLIIPYWKTNANGDNIYISYRTGDTSLAIESVTWSTSGVETSAKYRGFSVTEGTDGGTYENPLNYASHNDVEFPFVLNSASGNMVNGGVRGYVDFWMPQRADIWGHDAEAVVTSDIPYYSGGYSFDMYGYEPTYETEASRISGYAVYDLEKDNDDLTGFVIYNEARRTIKAGSTLHLLGLKLNLSTS